MYTPVEDAHGIHAGDIETSLILHFRPELVRMDKARNFVSTAIDMEQRYKRLRTTGMPAYGWMAGDINPDGAAGDATLSTAEKGRLTAEHQALGFIELLQDVTEFPLSDLS
jgi:creatinine amidohydrolase